MRKLLILFSYLLIFASCGNNKKQAPFSGGTFSSCLNTTHIVNDPAWLDDFNSSQILSQIYEGLVAFDSKDLTIKPQLAKKYEVKNDGLLYEFTLRDDVLFQDFGASDKKRKFSAKDVVFSIERACLPNNKGMPSVAYSMAYQGKLKGADEYFEGKSKRISGITVKGNIISLELTQPDFNFLAKMSQSCCAILSEELYRENENFIGTGPFVLHKELDSPESVKLVKNQDYYLFDKKGFALPYLDTVEFVILSKKLEQLSMFEDKRIDVIYGLPSSRITEMLEGRIEDFTSQPSLLTLHNSAMLCTDYYYFDMTEERFKDPRVRQAFNLAINKNKIGQNVLRNQYYELGNYGIVPPLKNLFRGYDFQGVRKNAYEYDLKKAKSLLAAAGYPEGEGFGTVMLRFNIDDVHSAVADEFAKQIRNNLGITVNIDGSSFEQLTKDQEKSNGDIFRMTWVADYASPETFLQKFSGKYVPKDHKQPSALNNSRYVNPTFDDYFEKAKSSTKLVDRRKFFSLAEQELMKDPPIIPLWYSGELSVIYSNVRGFNYNSLNITDLRKVYIKEWTQQEYLESKSKKH